MINCGKLTTCGTTEMNTSTEDRPWGVNNPRYQLFAYGPSNNFIETGTLNSPFYVIVWVADDPAETDNDPTKDGNDANNKGTRRHHPARGSVGRPRGPQDYRSDADPHGFDRNRARLHRPARSGRTEPPRPQGGGADTRRRVDAKRIDDSVGVREIRIMSQMKYGRVVAGALMLAAILARPEAVSAQLDPLLMIKKGTPATPVKPNVIFAIDTSPRMQLDADGVYYDPNVYTRQGGLFDGPWESNISVDAPTATYRRKYTNLQPTNSGGDKYTANRIDTIGNDEPGYADFYSKTRLLVARIALAKALTDNTSVTRFGLIKTRQNTPTWGSSKNVNPVQVSDGESAGERARSIRQVGGHDAHSQRQERIDRGSADAARADRCRKLEHQRAHLSERGSERGGWSHSGGRGERLE